MGIESIRIGRLGGIPIGVPAFWIVIVALITWSLGAVYYPDQVDGIAPLTAYGLGLLSALLLFASILLHELGHAVVARRNGVEESRRSTSGCSAGWPAWRATRRRRGRSCASRSPGRR